MALLSLCSTSSSCDFLSLLERTKMELSGNFYSCVWDLLFPSKSPVVELSYEHVLRLEVGMEWVVGRKEQYQRCVKFEVLHMWCFALCWLVV